MFDGQIENGIERPYIMKIFKKKSTERYSIGKRESGIWKDTHREKEKRQRVFLMGYR
jgi:hypothetical protein